MNFQTMRGRLRPFPPVLVLSVVPVLGCGGAPHPDDGMCATTLVHLEHPNQVGGAASAHVYWDVSKSMDRFAGKDGPLTTLNQQMESSVLQGSDVLAFEHFTVADSIEPMSPLQQPIRLTGNWSNLPDLAYRAGLVFVEASSPTMTLIVSDMKVETPPALRKRMEGVEAPCDLPLSAIPSTESAPFLLRECMKAALGDTPIPTEGWMSVTRWEVGERALYAVLASRDYKRGRAVHKALAALDSKASSSSKVIFAFPPTVFDPETSGGLCRFDPAVVDPVTMNHSMTGQQAPCRFRFRGADAPPHIVRCAIPTINGSGIDAVVTGSVVGLSRNGKPVQAVLEDGWYEIQTLPGSEDAQAPVRHVLSSGASTASLDALAGWCAEPNSTAGDALAGIASGISGRLVPVTSTGWTVTYEGM